MLVTISSRHPPPNGNPDICVAVHLAVWLHRKEALMIPARFVRAHPSLSLALANRIHVRPAHLLVALVVVACIVAAAYGVFALTDSGSGGSAGQAGGGGDAPAGLAEIHDQLPRPADAIVDEDEVYTGGSVLGSIYWSKQSVSEIIGFYEQRMSAGGWEVVSVTRPSKVPATDKAAEHEIASATFQQGSSTVTITAAENREKDPERGTTRIGISIEDKSVDLTAP